MSERLSAGQLDALRHIDSCTLANAIGTYRLSARNDGAVAGSVRCLFPRLPAMVGHAATLRIRSVPLPASGVSTYVESSEWWDYVLSVPAPRVVVVEDVSAHPGRAALLSEVHVSILRALGCVGAVTNGAVRDVEAVEALGFHYFAADLSVAHSYVQVVATGSAVEIDGRKIESGHLLHGDRHGVQVVPRSLATELPFVAAKMLARERKLIALANSPNVTVEKLRRAIASERPA